MSFSFTDLPSLVKTAKELYDFGKEINIDVKNWQEKKQKKKLKKILTDLKKLIGCIDQMYSELLLLDKISSMDKKQFDKNKKRFEKIYDKVQAARDIILDIVRIDYFHDFHEIRDVLFVKLGGEVEMEPGQPWPEPEPKPSEDLKTFQRYVEHSSITTRKALVVMKKHIKENFD